MLISVVTVRGRRRGEIVFGGVDYAHYKKNWQIIITMINHAIGASRVVRKECKTIIAKLLPMVMNGMLEERLFWNEFSYAFSLLKKICSKSENWMVCF
ncbi:uncharacterized protein LOC131637924 isoform X1 [Vicia villosa]|uniref:uncharacterized protein LOC131637924 isoform X1 n=1 Tax=Vicia villosa TaxID=3911 RepID=UPI00273AAA88|nr:uncharacterized protein LOC131637924 isoform X1 [Vicia villosa]